MFQKAIPVWVEQQLNTHLVFHLEAQLTEPSVLRLSAADFYKVYLNGTLLGVGPARTAESYARVDEYSLVSPSTSWTTVGELFMYLTALVPKSVAWSNWVLLK
jgi:hypothetical protein